ncbi:MAG TPA: hypothetical protein VHG51_16530 [Longimicrobiaceae bacterium]|nr:hypothetical protein [Longimicrobiaceae bacterium]
MKRLRFLLWLAVLLPWAAPARAQDLQVPLDERGRVEVVDAALAARLGLFQDRYPGFREARLFQAPDSSYVLEITMVRDGRTARQRVALTAEEVHELRRQVSERIAARAPGARVDQDGRYLLLGQTTLLGVGFYGWAVPYVVGAEDTGALSLYLITAGASFFLPYALTEGQPVTYGMANLSRYGATRGISHGLLLHQLLFGDPEGYTCDDFTCYDDEGDDRARAGIALLASAAEGVGGYLWARREGMAAGTANAIGTGGDFGLLGGMGVAYLAGTDDVGERATAAIALPAAAAGIVAGHRIAARRDYTWGDADVIYTAGAVGALAGWAAADLATFDERPAVAAAMLGAAGGLYLGDRRVRDTDFTVGQASLNRLGAIAGGLVGLGFGALVSIEDEDPTAALTGAALGATLGYLGTYASLAPLAREQRGESGPLGWRVQLSPRGVLGLAGGALPRSGEPVPVVSFSRTF